MPKCLPFLFVAALTGLPIILAQGSQVPFSITIDAETNVFRAGSEIRIRLVLKNTSTAEIPYVRGPGIGVEPHGERFTNIEVRDAKGELIPETRYHRALRGRPETSARPTAPKKSGVAPDESERPQPRKFIWSSLSYMLRAWNGITFTLHPGVEKGRSSIRRGRYGAAERALEFEHL